MAAGSAKESWWALFNNQISANSVVLQAANKDAAIKQYFQQEAGGQVGSHAQTAVLGPFPTQAEATTAAKTLDRGRAPGASAASTIPNPFSWVGAIAHWIGDLVEHLTDVHMWISLGWIALGLLLVALGINLWFKIPQKLFQAGTTAAAAAAI